MPERRGGPNLWRKTRISPPEITLNASCPPVGDRDTNCGCQNHPKSTHWRCRYRCRRAGGRALCGADAAVVVPRSQRTRRDQGVPEAGNAAADRIVQVPRRLQQAVVDPAGQARRRRGRVLLRQPRPGRGGGGADPEHAGDHRDAGGRAASPSASAPRAMAPRSCSTTATRKTAKPSPTASPRKRGATLVRPYDDPFVIAGQGTAGREIAEDMAALGLVARYRGGAGIRRRADRRRCDRGEGAVSAGAGDRRRARRTMTITACRCAPATARPITPPAAPSAMR